MYDENDEYSKKYKQYAQMYTESLAGLTPNTMQGKINRPYSPGYGSGVFRIV
jgi:hypothetical protein